MVIHQVRLDVLVRAQSLGSLGANTGTEKIIVLKVYLYGIFDGSKVSLTTCTLQADSCKRFSCQHTLNKCFTTYTHSAKICVYTWIFEWPTKSEKIELVKF